MSGKAQDNARTDESGMMYTRESFSGKGRVLPILCVFLLILPIALLGAAFAPRQDEAIGLWVGEVGDTGALVGAAMDIEDIWAIEDERTESEAPLVTAMFNGRDSLGYDAASATFYCTLGLGNEIDWPELSLTAKGADGVQAVWVDDYSYDWCKDAIRKGYRYELLTYTPQEYAYIGVVFTGLPIVALNAPEEIGDDDVLSEIHISGAGYESLHSMALTHMRGGGYKFGEPKQSYHIELRTRAITGSEHKSSLSVLGMEPDTDWLLLANIGDKTCLKNYVSWELWKDWKGEDGLTTLDSRMVEVFLDNEYKGIYQLMQRIDAKAEIKRIGGNPDTDVVGRKIRPGNTGWRPRREIVGTDWIELRYAPPGMSEDEGFDVLFDYIQFERAEGIYAPKEVFAQHALEHFDVKELLDYFLFLQAICAAIDNVGNNAYVWALKNEEGNYMYYLSPWDMDSVFGDILPLPEGLDDQMNLWLKCATCMLEMNLGDSRRIVWDIWNEKRATLLEDSAMYQRIADAQEMINASGAYRRESLLYYAEEQELNAARLLSRAVEHLSVVDYFMNQLYPLEESEKANP